VLATVVILHAGRAWTLNNDDWGMILYRRSGGPAAFLAPHNGNLEPLLVMLYRLLFAIVGLRHYLLYRLIELAFHLLLAVMLFEYLRRRLQPAIALLLTLPVLFLANGYSVLIWSYDCVWIIPLICLLVILLLRDRGSSGAPWATCLVLLLAVTTSGPAIPVLVVVAVDTLLEPRRRREWWAVALPVAVYLVWFTAYRSHALTPLSLRSIPGAVPTGDAQSSLHAASIPHLPHAVLQTVNSAAGGILGLRAASYLPLGLVSILVVLLIHSTRIVNRRAIAFAAGAVTLWLLVASVRSGQYGANRYVYSGAVLLVLTIGELAASLAIRRVQLIAAAAATAAVLAFDAHHLHQDSRFVIPGFATVRAQLEQLGCQRGAPSSAATTALLPLVTRGPLQAAEHALGSPIGSCPDAGG
jgi:hypothetical protein